MSEAKSVSVPRQTLLDKLAEAQQEIAELERERLSLAESMRERAAQTVAFYVDAAWRHRHTLDDVEKRAVRMNAKLVEALIRNLPLEPSDAHRGMSKGLSPAEYRCWLALWKHLSDEQKQKVRHKAEWEHVTLLGVFWDWPSLFGEEGEALHRAFSDE